MNGDTMKQPIYRYALTGDDVMKYNKHRNKRSLLKPGDIILMSVGAVILLSMIAGAFFDVI
ncbi:hypothetical protein vBVpP1_44 [Vibrio phage vB_VpP_1]|nr:hypothetical protein vBVpP1_44 [Vibrio phage vB_VpP_1]